MSMPTIQNLALQLPIVLLHFLWQGAIIGVIAIVANYLIGERWVRLSYAWNLLLLVCLLMCIPFTFAVLTRNSSIEVSTAVVVHQADNAVAVPPTDQDSPENIKTAEAEALTPKVAAVAMTSGVTGETMMRICITIAYCLGVLAMLSRTALAAWKIHRLRGVGTSDSPEWLLTTIRSKAKQMGMAMAPALRVCNEVSVPVVVGLMRPLILVPTSILTNLKHHEIETILVHELAHIRRYDLWVNLFQRVVEAILFFHPAVWYVSKLTSRYREMCCDEWVIRQGHDKLQYASALINMAKLSLSAGNPGIDDQLALAAGKVTSTDFNRRVRRLLGVQTVQHSGMREWLGFSTTAVVIIVLCCVIATSNSVAAQEPTEYVTPSQKLEFLKKLVAARRENIAKIHTWKATYQYESRTPRSEQSETEPVWLRSQGELQFTVDFDKKLLHSYMKPIGKITVEDAAGKPVDNAYARSVARGGTSAADWEYILTDTDVIQYDRGGSAQNMPGSKTWIEGQPRGASKVILTYRKNEANQVRYMAAFEPIELFVFDGSKDPVSTRYEHLVTRLLSLPAEQHAEWLEPINIKREGDTWIVLSGREASAWNKGIFDLKLQDYLEYSFGSDKDVAQKYEIKHRLDGGVSIPSKQVRITDIGGQEMKFTLKLVASEMNPVLSVEDFTMEALDIPNGTRRIDYGDKAWNEIGSNRRNNFGRRPSHEDRENEMAKMTTVYLDGKWLSIEDYNKTVAK